MMSLVRAVLLWLSCRVGQHAGICVDGVFLCDRCNFVAHYHAHGRMGTKTTDPGGVDGPPYDRPYAEGWYGIDPEAGARQGGDPDDPDSGRDLPL
jgi:hypothetical protein